MNHHQLESLLIFDNHYDNFDSICNGIRKGLRLNTEKEGHFQIFIQIGEETYNEHAAPVSSAALMKISEILVGLEKSTKLNDFILEVIMYGKIDDGWELQKKQFYEKNNTKFKIDTRSDIWSLKVSNKNCKINDFQQTHPFRFSTFMSSYFI